MLPLTPVLSIFGLPGGVTHYAVASSIGPDGVEQTSEVATSIQAVVSYASPRDVELLGEGYRTSTVLEVLSASTLRVGDEILYRPPGDATAQRWRLVKVADWLTQAGHYRAFAVAR